MYDASFLSLVEFEKNALQDKVRTFHKEEEASAKLQQRIQQFEGQMSETQLCLEKEKAKYHSAYRQQEVGVMANSGSFNDFSWRLWVCLLLLLWFQSMQAKQQSLLKRVDDLHQECEELQGQLGEQEERRIELCNQLLHMSDEKDKLHVQLTKQEVYWRSLIQNTS